MRTALISAAAAACGLGVLLGADGEPAGSTMTVRAPAPPAPPGGYRVPRHAVDVSTAGELHAALARHARTTIVLAPGTYRSRTAFLNPHGHHLYAARRGRAVLKAGLSLGGNGGRPGALVRGLTLDIRDRKRTVDNAAITVWGSGRGVRILDTTVRGNGVTDAGIAARQPEGLRIARVVVRNFTDYGILVDANDTEHGPLSDPFRVQDADVARIARPDPGSSDGRAESCVWIGNGGSVRRVRARDCAWAGLWTGTATIRATVEDVDVDRTRTGVYVEHFTRESTFRRLRIGRQVRVGLTAEWADPAWGRRPASIGNVIEASRFESALAGVYLDEGTTRTTVRRSSFANQSWAAIGDYRGAGNTFDGNDYDGIDPGAQPVRNDHLSSAGG